MPVIYAKSKPVQTLREHTDKVHECYEQLKATAYLNPVMITLYDTVIRLVLEIHDKGKTNPSFQNRLRTAIHCPLIKPNPVAEFEEIPHEWLSLAFLPQDMRFLKQYASDWKQLAKIIRYAVAFHHTRNVDREACMINFSKFVTAMETTKLDIEHKEALQRNVPALQNIKSDIAENIATFLPSLVFIKGILHKCDYAASAGIPVETRYDNDYEDVFSTWIENQDWQLKPFQKTAKTSSEKSVVLIAPTGSGKTEYAMNWINGSKAFYLLGLRTAVNAMYKRFKSVFGTNVALLHGEIASALIEEETDDTSSYSSYFEKLEKARKLAAPLTVATADQLVTSVFKYNGFEMPYLTASYSKIVLDEVQSYSSDAIAAIVRFLKDIHGLGGRFLLMTATLPSFVKDELLSLPGVEFQMAPFTEQKRHRIAVYEESIDDSSSVNRIIKDYDQGRKVLVICNTVKKAQAMYDLLCVTSPQLLHSRFIQQDRNNKEQAILTATVKTGSCVWISTQVVEASLDIDFDVLYTECSTIDSLLQRFGRCFRKRDFHGEQPNIHIYSASKESLNIYDPEILSRTYDQLRLDYNGHILFEVDKYALIEKIFNNIQSTKYYGKYKSKINLLECMDPLATKKAEANEMFRNITNNYRVIPMPVYVKNKEEIEEQILKADSMDTEMIEKIKARNAVGRFVVPVQLHGDWKKRLLTINHSLFCKRNGISIIRDVTYSCDRGLQFGKGDDFDDRCI